MPSPNGMPSTSSLELPMTRSKTTKARILCRTIRTSRFGALVFSMVTGAITVFLQSSQAVKSYFFGDNWERAWLWWLVFVPIYLACGIMFARFVGTFLLRMWTQDIVSAKFTHQAVAALLEGILAEPQVTEALAGSMKQNTLIDAVSQLTAGVLQSSEVQKAAANTVASSLRDQSVIEAAGDSIEPMLQTSGLHRGLVALQNDERLVEPLVTQAGRILADERMVDAVAGFLHETLERGEVREAIMMRVKSIAGDAGVIQAGAQGFRNALTPSMPAAFTSSRAPTNSIASGSAASLSAKLHKQT